VTLHDLQPAPGVPLRPPPPAEQPARRIVFYGTSITHGAGASSPHLTYPQMCSAHLHADAINLGLGGACHAEPQLANWIAGRDDWDAAVLALSVNMMGFSDDDFSRRVHDFVHTVATAHPANPVFAITLWPYRGDLPTFDGEGDKVQRFRQHLRDAVASCPTDNAYLLEGPDLLQRFDGLSTDLIHPGDAALVEMARRLADAMQPHLDLPAA
jgi:lysophospholipase L1-like esterase